MASEIPELDDFGLPIRKWVPPSEPKPEPEKATNVPSETKATATDDKPDKAKELADADTKKVNVEVASAKAQPDKTAQDEDAEVFVDARSNSGTAPTTPKQLEVPGNDSTTPEPCIDDKSQDISTKAVSAQKGDLKNEEQPARSSEQSLDVHNTTVTRGKSSHGRNESMANSELDGVSHHQATKEEVKEEKDDDDGWQEMPAFARYDMYNDDDKLIAKEHNVEDDETYGYSGLGGAGKGYTRVDMDEDAQSATSMDDNTKYLFKGTHGTNLADEDDEEQRDAVSQMQATKDLLTEGQKIAYVGLTRLEIFQLVREAESLEKTRGAKKEVVMGAESTQMWGQKMMLRVYTHMDISADEQVMVEQLTDHGVVPSDLTPILMTNARVKNPMAEEKKSLDSNIAFDETKLDSPRDSRAGTDDASNLGSPKSPPDTRSAAQPTEEAPSFEEEKAAEPPPPYEAHPEGELPDVKMPSQLPSSQNLEIDLRWTVLCDLFLLLIADSTYDSRSRLLLERVGKSLEIDWLDIRKFEKKVTDALEMQQEAEKENWNEDEHMEHRRQEALKKRYVMMGLATVGGGLVIGLSAGLLAPLIGAGLAAGFTTIGVTGTGAFLGGAGGAAVITTAAASSGGVVGVRAAHRRTGAVKTFEYRPLHNNKRVNLIVSVSGWMTGKADDVRLPFSPVDPLMGDLYSVLWEPDMLRSTGDTINILATEALTQGLQQVLGNTILMGLMAALQLPLILTKLAYLIDNPWAVSLDRATSAGKILADSLIDRNLGTRPVTLVGFSIGARVVFSCLQELAKRGAHGLVQNVYMFGSPVVVKKDEYLRARTVAPGRFVNAYNRNDWILGYLFRLTNGGIQRVAGLAPIEGLDWLENIDVSNIVKGHMEYRKNMPKLLRECGWLVESDEFTEIEDPDPENHTERQRELINEIEAARKELEKEGQKKKSSRFSIFGRKKQLEKADWEVYNGQGNTGPGKEGNGQGGDGEGVLFDMEAIRTEMAKNGADEMQIRELQSTLPPMKLDLQESGSGSGMASSSGNLWDHPRGTKSAEAVNSLRPSHESKSISEGPSPSPAGSSLAKSRVASSYFAEPEPQREGDISMTFDTSFHDDAWATSAPPPPPPPKDEGSGPSPAPVRPDMKTSQTMPNMTLRDPWNDPDDDEFGKEKEMTMTFA